MTILHCYVGLPGSGKTYRAKQDMARLGGTFLDDKFKLGDLIYAVKGAENVFITDPSLCEENSRNGFVKICAILDAEIKWYWFENNVEKALNNIQYRRDGRVISVAALKNYYAKVYKIPIGVEVIPIWQPKGK